MDPYQPRPLTITVSQLRSFDAVVTGLTDDGPVDIPSIGIVASDANAGDVVLVLPAASLLDFCRQTLADLDANPPTVPTKRPRLYTPGGGAA